MKRILVIDSDPVTSTLTQKFLRNYNFEADVVQDGKTALDQLDSIRYDLVLSDIQLKELGGFDVLKLMRKCYIDVPFVFFTADDDVVTRMEAESMGAAKFISKNSEYINLPHILDQYFFPTSDLVA